MNSLIKSFRFLALTSALPAFGQLNYTDFSSATGLQLNGSAAVSGSALRITPATFGQAGSVFSTSAITLGSDVSFSTFFQFRITGSGGAGDDDGLGADGITFVIQTVANNVGSSGGGIGYQGIPNSVGIEFDTWSNGTFSGDPDGNHVNVNYSGLFSSASDAVPIPNRMNDGDTWSAWVDYQGSSSSLELRLAESTSVRPTAATLTRTVDLASVLGSTNAFVGFTSGTGAAFGNHDILNWEFRSSYDPITGPGTPISAVPEPSTYGFLGAALALMAVIWSKREKLPAPPERGSPYPLI